MAEQVKWACPDCGADASKHGKGGKEKCIDRHAGSSSCSGFLCECEDDGTDPEHGLTFEKKCPNAICHHCGFEGEFPKMPRGMQAWEKQALKAGWTPPAKRKKELGLA